MKSKGKVLVFGSDTKSFLSVIRSLGRKQIEIHIAWCNPHSASRYSRYIAKEHQVPKYQPQDDEWKSVLQNIFRREKFDLVIPCDDPSIIPLQINRSEFENLARFYLVNNKAFRITYDKYESIELARSLGIPVPYGMLLNSKEELERKLYEFNFPVVLKPLTSFNLDNLNYRRTVKKAFDVEELRSVTLDLPEMEPILVQNNFIGTGVGVAVIADGGEILTAFQHERVHQPIHGGGSSYRKSVVLHPELYEAVKKLMKALDYTGVAMIEFLLNSQTRRWVFVEINARFWGSLPLAISCGIDFPWYLYQLLVLGKKEFEKTYRINLYCRSLVEDIEWLRTNIRVDRSNKTIYALPIKKVILELTNILAFRERSDTFVMDDLLPGFMDLFFLVKQKYQKMRKSLIFKIGNVNIIKVLNRKRVAKAICINKSILFVCTGNICRSPFAEQYARRIFKGDFSVLSCGVDVVKGKKTPDNAIRVSKEHGIDLRSHSAIPLSRELVENSGIIFVFDEIGYNGVVREYPSMKSKLSYLGLFLENRNFIIEDPIGHNPEIMKRVYQDIVQAISKLKSYVDKRWGL